MSTEESYPKLISLAVHELRTPAGVVGGYLRMLQRDTDAPLTERQRKMVDEAEKSCARLVTLIAALSEVGKIDDGQVTMSAKPIDVFRLVAEVAEGVHESQDREVRFEVRGPDSGAPMAGDDARLRAAFGAVFHAILREKAGPCTVVAERRLVRESSRSSAVVIVADERCVQAAYDAPAGAFDEKRGGVGLSLPIARRVIEAHGGRLSSPAYAKGSGATDPASATGEGGFDERAARSTAVIFLPLGS
jgi:signal transduction histidine kinase